MELLAAELRCLARCVCVCACRSVCVYSLALLASDPWQREADWSDRSADIAHDVCSFSRPTHQRVLGCQMSRIFRLSVEFQTRLK